MTASQPPTPPPGHDLADQVRRRADRVRHWLRTGDPSLARQFAAVGVLGWLVVVPALLGTWAGRRLDHWLDTGITMTAALLTAGVALGCWSAWRWMHDR